MATVPKAMTAEELLRLPDDGCHRYELLRGELTVMSPTGWRHTSTEGRIYSRLDAYAGANRMGDVLPGDAGFVLARNPDTVLSPDVSFIRAERVPTEDAADGFIEGAPDLAVEVVSPSNTRPELTEKAELYLAHGTRLVWVVDPRKRTVQVFRPGQDVVELSDDDAIDGGDVLPGFSCVVRDLFATARRGA